MLKGLFYSLRPNFFEYHETAQNSYKCVHHLSSWMQSELPWGQWSFRNNINKEFSQEGREGNLTLLFGLFPSSLPRNNSGVKTVIKGSLLFPAWFPAAIQTGSHPSSWCTKTTNHVLNNVFPVFDDFLDYFNGAAQGSCNQCLRSYSCSSWMCQEGEGLELVSKDPTV